MHESVLPRVNNEQALGDVLPALQRQDHRLQGKLQMLIDSQAEGLMAGLKTHQADDHVSGKSTPTVKSATAGSSSSELPDAVSLQAARVGIWRTIQELADIKGAESNFFEDRLIEDQNILDQIERWEQKQHGLDKEVQHIEDSSDGQRTRDLQLEADQLQVEINEAESRLSAMKLQHKHMTEEIASINNSVQAKLSSYKASLEILNLDIKTFLQHPPKEARRNSSQSDFHSLPESRRTLTLAYEHWQTEQANWIRRQDEAALEHKALIEGARMWRGVVSTITRFERKLGGFMKEAGTRSPRAGSLDPAMEELLMHMNSVIDDLQEKCEDAEGKDWKLLTCCIGAELEAFIQGRELLHGEPKSVPVFESTNGFAREGRSEPSGMQPEGTTRMKFTVRRL